MTIVDRYLVRSFLGSYLILLAVSIGLYILIDVLVNVDEFVGEHAPSLRDTAGILADYYGYQLPYYFSLLGGPLLAIAAAFVLGQMVRNNELTPLLAAGMPLQRLAVPLLICTTVLLGGWVANQELLIPWLAPQIARSRDDIAGTRTLGVYYVRDDRQAVVVAQHFDPRDGVLERVQFLEPGADGMPIALIDADEAKFDPGRQTWTLTRGRRASMTATSDLTQAQNWTPLAEFAYSLTPAQLVLRQRAEWVDMLSLRQMNALLQSDGQRVGTEVVVHSRHVRLTQPLVYLILVLLTLPFFLSRMSGGVLGAASRSLVVTGVFFGLAFVAQSFEPSGFPSWFGALGDWLNANRGFILWVPILCFGPVAVMLLSDVKT